MRSPGAALQDTARHRAQRGMVLIMSLLLLVVVTLLAVAMFRGMGIGAKIAGNVREKTRALNAAMSAEQWAEWWLANNGSTAVANVCSAVGNANTSTPQVCQNIPYGPTAQELPTPLTPTTAAFVPTQVPWILNGGGAVGYTYTPPNMLTVSGGTCASGQNCYALPPMMYISYLGLSADGSGGLVYQIDTVGYGGTADSIAVLESTYELSSGVSNPGSL